jgi:D-serine deaminase-like pyridoxal phosphate-dependent protein
MHLKDLSTPAAVVDLDKVQASCAWMSQRAHDLGVKLRPHVKTHKCLAAARLQMGDHGAGIAVSTLAEAAHFAAGGCKDIIYAVPIAPQKVAQALALSDTVDRLALLVDSAPPVDAIEQQAAGRMVPVFLKVDCGYGRAGVSPDKPLAMEMAQRLHSSPAIDFRGLLTHGGHSYDCGSRAAIARVAEQERDVVVGFAKRLQAQGIPVPEVSVGSTPTMRVVDDLSGVTEIRPGNYVFFDVFQSMIGSCTLDEVGFSVLTTVIGSYPDRNLVVVDAGALALSKDVGATHVDASGGYGVVCDERGQPHRGMHLGSLSQEHGKISVDGVVPAVGTLLRVMPNHSCLSAALFDQYYVVRNQAVVDVWHPVRGWAASTG